MSPGRLGSWALGAAFVVLVGLAVADTVRKRGEPAPAAPPGHERLQAALRAARVGGELLVTPPGRCRTTVWSLPDLRRRGADRPCAPPPDSLSAERPDGHRSLVDEEGVVLLLSGCEGAPDCRRVLIAKEALERAGLRHLNAPSLARRLRVLVDGVAWLSDARAAVLLSLRIAGRPDLGGNQLVALFEGGELDAQASFFRGDLRRPTASPDRGYVALLPGIVLRADGTELSLPAALAEARALAWSPDGRWLALAQRGSVVLVSVESLERYDAGGSGPRTIDLPLEAAELEWR